ncbi:M43 family zinc metalloprotease [Pseudofulvibacter geojedonensis]|uniref:M43 family zinc metalloprotease n=1 Tax=Pseudofulvibacter geojedonensis TaxID=1123758 RepID=A0ABW3I6G6_9FLAO
MRKIVLILCLFIASIGIAQQRNCASMENLEYREANDPGLKQRMANIEAFTKQHIQNTPASQKINGDIITIPVVVHVIYNSAKTEENISDAQIQSQIDVLNEDFRRTNSDADNTWSQAADTQIEFCLASVDPNGNATNGITRKSSSKASWGTSDDMKKASQGGVNPWNTAEYLNMWVCNIGGGILGYAQFPGGSAATDGVVMSPQYFGSKNKGTGFYLAANFDLGRTTTHEVGHYLNLRHIWGDGPCGSDDFVSDTPESDAANYGCATGHSSCGSTDMVQNYMDYSNDSCMNLYTQGQKDRMRAVLAPGGSRRALALSDKCGAAPTPTCTDGIQNGDETGVDCGGSCAPCNTPPTCTDGIQNGDETGVDCGGSSCEPCQTGCNENEVIVKITFDNYPEETSWEIKNDSGTVVASKSYSSSNPDGSTVEEKYCLPNDCYTFTIKDAYGDGICCSYGNGSYTVTGPNGVIKSGGSFTSSEATNFCFGTTAPTCSDGIQNGDETGVDCGGSCAPCQPTCSDVKLRLKFDNYPEETSWEIKNNSGTVVASGGTYANQADGSILNITECLPAGCYSLVMKDAYGDGMCCSYGNGSFRLTNVSTGAVLASGASFNSTITKNFCIGTTRNDMLLTEEAPTSRKAFGIKLFPNPVSEGTLNIVKESDHNASYKIVNHIGQELLSGEIKDMKSSINVNQLKTGVYFISISTSKETITKQFIKR